MKNSLLAPLILGGAVVVAVGAYAGTRMNPWQDYADVVSVVPAFDNQKVPGGFDVTYLLDGTQGVVRMDHDPGKRIPLENGELDLSRT